MGYPVCTNTFVESSTAYATAVNQNFLDVVNGVSDGTKDIRVNDATVQGTLTLSNALTSKTILPSVADTYDLGSAAGAWNNVWMNQLSVETALVSAAGHVAFRAVGNYVNSDQANYLDLHAVTQVRVNAPAQVAGSFVVSGALSAAGSGYIGGAFGVAGTATMSGNMYVAGTMTVADTATFNGYLSVNSNLVTHDIYPALNNSYVVGDSTHKYHHAWLQSATIDSGVVMNSIGGSINFYDANNSIYNPALGELNIIASGGSGIIRLGGTITTRGHTPESDASYDIGTNASQRYRDAYFSRNVFAYGSVALYSGAKLIFDSNANHFISGTSTAMHIYGLNAINIEGYSAGSINIFNSPTNFYAGVTQFNQTADGTSDFSVHGDTVNDTLFVDVSANRVGVLTSAPSQAFTVNGAIAANSITFQTAATGNAALDRYQTGSFDTNWQGIGTATTITCQYVKVGKQCTLYMPQFYGVSTAATFSLPTTDFPAGIAPRNVAGSDMPFYPYPAHHFDNSGASSAGALAITASRIYAYIYASADYSVSGWTASAQKSINYAMQITYMTD